MASRMSQRKARPASFRKRTRETFLGLLRPPAGLHEGPPRIGNGGDGTALLCDLPVYFSMYAASFCCGCLGSEAGSPFAAAFGLFDPALRRVRPRQPASKTSDIEIDCFAKRALIGPDRQSRFEGRGRNVCHGRSTRTCDSQSNSIQVGKLVAVYATTSGVQPKFFKLLILKWSGRVDSNHRPPGPEPGCFV